MLQLQKKEKVFRRATRVGVHIHVAVGATAAYAMGMESGGVRQTIPGAHS